MTDRRDFIKAAGIVAGAAMMPRFSFASVKGSDRIKVGLIGCGARGTAAATNMIQADQNIEIVALADLFEDKPALAEKRISDFCAANFPKEKGDIIKEGKVKKFFGWDCADQLLKEDVDVVIEATPPVFRTPHYAKIVEAGKHAFLEKPACVDAVQARKMLELSKKADEKGLSVVCGTQRRYHEAYQEIIKRIHDGAIGKITSARAYWNQASHTQHEPRKDAWSDMEWQLRNWIYFTWLSGDIIVEQHLHNLDVINWAMQAHPIKAYGMGGQAARFGKEFGHIYDHFCVEYEYPGGVRMTSMCRQTDNCSDQIGEAVVGTEGTSNCMNTITAKTPFRFSGKFRNPYEQEHVDLIESIRAGQPLNEAQQIAESNLGAIMGRESAYSGKIIDWDSAMESKMDLSPAKYEFGPLPVPPVAIPGTYKFE